MSMLGMVGQISDSDIDKLSEEPKRVEQLLNNGTYFEQKQSFWKTLFSKQVKPVYSWTPDAGNRTCDMDKAWHLLHFVFTGNAEGGNAPENFIMAGGQEIGEDFGYGPTRFFRANATEDIGRFVAKLTDQDVRSRLDNERLKGQDLYPIYDGELAEEEQTWILEELVKLKDFFQQTIKERKGFYVYIS
jgi:hypothetical protein